MCVLPRVIFVLMLWFLSLMVAVHSDFWLDEAVSLRISSLSVEEIWFGVDAHPPLYYFLLKSWTSFVDDGTGRLLSVILGVLLLCSLWFMSGRLWGFTSSSFVVGLGAMSSVLLSFSAQSRMYILVMLLLVWSWWFFRECRPFLGSLLWVLAVYSHVYAVFFILCLPSLFKFYKRTYHLVLSVVGGSLLVLPLLHSSLGFKGAVGGEWLPDLSALSVFSHFLWKLQVPSSGLALGFITLEFIVAGFLLYILFFKSDKCELKWLAFGIPLWMFLLGLLEFIPFHHRHLSIFLPFVLLLFGELWKKNLLSKGVLFVFLLLNVVLLVGFLSSLDTDIQDAVALVDCPANVLHYSTFSLLPAEYYLSGCRHFLSTELGREELMPVGGFFVEGFRVNQERDFDYYFVPRSGSLEVIRNGSVP